MKPLDLVDAHINAGNASSAARILSSLIRSAMTDSVKAALIAKAAQNPAIKNHPDFII